ncbi:MAG: MqnA/MqnD/SBP family protein [Bacteroidota bacterium]
MSASAPLIAVWDTPAALVLGQVLADAIGGQVRLVEPWTAASALGDGSADLALVPTLSVLRQPETFDLAPAAGLVGVASPSRALAVGVPLNEITTVAFDPRFGQEALLAQLILREHFDARPQFTPVETADLASVQEHGAALVPVDLDLPDGVVALDLGREWSDLTTRPMVWGLVASRKHAMGEEAAHAIAEAVAATGDPTGSGEYQLSLTGLGYDGLEAFADHLFYTGTLDGIPELSFVGTEPDEDEVDALDKVAESGTKAEG